MAIVSGDLKPFLAIYPPLSFTFVIQGVFQDEGKPGGETLIYMVSSTSNNCLRNMYIIFLFLTVLPRPCLIIRKYSHQRCGEMTSKVNHAEELKALHGLKLSRTEHIMMKDIEHISH